MKPQDAITGPSLDTTIERHIRRYSSMLEHGGRGIRLGECRHYLTIWEQARDAKAKGQAYSAEFEQELYYALTSGDCDSYLSQAELDEVNALD
jgi:hypothetical protein